MTVLAAWCGAAETALIRYFQLLKNRFAIDRFVVLGIGCLEIPGGKDTDFVGPVGDAGGTFGGPLFKSRLGKYLPIRFFARSIGPFKIINRQATGPFDGNGFNIFGPQHGTDTGTTGLSPEIVGNTGKPHPVFSSRSDGENLKIFCQILFELRFAR